MNITKPKPTSAVITHTCGPAEKTYKVTSTVKLKKVSTKELK